MNQNKTEIGSVEWSDPVLTYHLASVWFMCTQSKLAGNFCFFRYDSAYIYQASVSYMCNTIFIQKCFIFEFMRGLLKVTKPPAEVP